MQRFKFQMHHTELKVHFDFFQSEFLHTEPLAEFQQDHQDKDMIGEPLFVWQEPHAARYSSLL